MTIQSMGKYPNCLATKDRFEKQKEKQDKVGEEISVITE